MLLWIGLGVMSAAVLAALLRPVLRAGEPAASKGGDATAVYRDQLAEIDAERERGLIAPAEAEAARIEISRRLLASDAAKPAAASATSTPAPISALWLPRLALAIAAIVPLLAVGLYLQVGAPQLPGQPLAERIRLPGDTERVDELVAAVEARLRQQPEDGQGWDVVAPVYLKQGRFQQAADAFQRAGRLLGESSRRLAGFAEATVLANDGIVTEPARLAYERLAKLEPGRVEPRFWLALAKEQDGQLAIALAEYQALVDGAPPDASWRPLVNERIDAVRARLGTAAVPAGSLQTTKKEAPTKEAATQPLRGPTADDVKAAETLGSADRQRMIEDMVQGLADRLQQDGRDLAGWQRLIRAYTVMGRKTEAVAALGRARLQFAGEAPSLAALAELAQNLGLDT